MNRRDFIKGSALAAGAMSIGVQAADKRVIRAAVVGCGGRGRAAAASQKGRRTSTARARSATC